MFPTPETDRNSSFVVGCFIAMSVSVASENTKYGGTPSSAESFVLRERRAAKSSGSAFPCADFGAFFFFTFLVIRRVSLSKSRFSPFSVSRRTGYSPSEMRSPSQAADRSQNGYRRCPCRKELRSSQVREARIVRLFRCAFLSAYRQ